MNTETEFLPDALRSVFLHLNEGVLWVDSDGKILLANEKIAKLLNRSTEELTKKVVFEINPHLNLLSWKKSWKVLTRQGYLEEKTEFITAEDKLVPVRVKKIYLDTGDTQRCILLVENQEPQVKNIPQRQDQDDIIMLTQFAIDHSNEIIIWVSDQNEIVYANQAFFEKTGYSLEETKTVSLMDLSPNPSVERSLAIWETLEKKRYLEIESEIKLKNGDIIPVFVFINFIEYKGRKLACTFIRDWSKKKIRDQQLTLSKFSLDRASELIFWVDSSGKITYANEAAHHALNEASESLMGSEFVPFFPDYEAYRKKASGNHQLRISESKLLKKNGPSIPVEASITSIPSEEHPIFCLILRDVTKRQEREAELKRTYHELENAYNQIEELSQKFQQQNIILKEEISQEHNFNNIITRSKKYKQILKQVSKVAETDATVLLFGETGTGKELLARAIHALSQRASEPMIKVNCAALSKNLIESELFGHEKGAFTGAFQQKKGRFEVAHMGTIFLDEIGEMPLDVQVKLLRVLQEGEFERIGSTETLSVDVRVVTATNRNLIQMVNEGRFREDLYYRLHVFPIENMPLRERKEDIPLLIDFFVKRYADKLGKKIKEIPQHALDLLMEYDFPGNIRELENIIERATILSSGETLNLDLSFTQRSPHQLPNTDKADFSTFEEVQKDHIIAALKRTNWRVSGPKGAAQLLDLNDRTLASKMRKFGIRREDYLDFTD